MGALLGFSFVKLIVLDVLLTGLSMLLEFAALVALRIREPGWPGRYRVPAAFSAPSPWRATAGAAVLTVIRNDAEPIGPINASIRRAADWGRVVCYFLSGAHP